MTGVDRCWTGKHVDAALFLRRVGRCTCAAHELSAVWHSVTGDSYIVDVVPVFGPAGAASYMAKYLLKDMLVRGRMEAAGFHRRWSSSRGWPGSGRLRLLYGVLFGWRRVSFSYGHMPSWLAQYNAPELSERSGHHLTKALEKRRVERATIGRLRRLLNASNVRKAYVSSDNSAGD